MYRNESLKSASTKGKQYGAAHSGENGGFFFLTLMLGFLWLQVGGIFFIF
jgi:hypothetical protein